MSSDSPNVIPFHVAAAITGTYQVPIGKPALFAYLSDPKTFAVHMPNVLDIDRVADGFYRWRFKIDLPLAEPVILVVHTAFDCNADTHEIKVDTAPDEVQTYLMCHVSFDELAPNGEEPQTDVKLQLKITIKRNDCNEIHPLAYMVSEDVVTYEMQKMMAEIVDAFVYRSVTQLYNS
jgi:carbon monoxide dehydrogenase subunit G